MQISYDYYRIFYHVVRCGSFTAAAETLLNNQPNITRAIKNLEAALGCTLFVRSNRGVRLTPEGEKLFAHVRIAFEHLEAGEEELSKEKSLQEGRVAIGVTEIALHCFLLPVLKRYRSLYPGVRLHVTNDSTPQAAASLKDGLLDLAVVTTPTVSFDMLTEKKLCAVREVAIGSAEYEELFGKKVSLERLGRYPIISLGAQAKSRERYREIFAAHGLSFIPEIEAATTDQILPMVRAGLGIGFVPEDMARAEKDIGVIDLEEKLPERWICLLKKKDRSLSIAARELERLIREASDQKQRKQAK